MIIVLIRKNYLDPVNNFLIAAHIKIEFKWKFKDQAHNTQSTSSCQQPVYVSIYQIKVEKQSAKDVEKIVCYFYFGTNIQDSKT